MIEKHVKANVSLLVATLAEAHRMRNPIVRQSLEMIEQAAKLAAPIEDCEKAARESGWKPCTMGRAKFINDTAQDTSGSASWEALCREHGIEPYQREVYEHWIVSDWLADRLIAAGERVDSIAELPIWARARNCPVAEDPAIVAIWPGTPHVA